MALLINGNGFSPVTAQEDADLYAGLVGGSLTVLNIGNNMAYSIQSATCVRILDGEAICQGRRIHLDPGTYDDFTIPSGSSGVTSYYIIGYHLYTDNDGNELAETFVTQMGNASATIAESVLRDGATETYVSFYRVTVTDLTIASVDALYNSRTYKIHSTHSIDHGQAAGVDVSAHSYADISVSFHFTFASKPNVVASLYSASTGYGVGSVSVSVHTITTSGFKARVFNNDSSTRTPYIEWIAVN